MPAGCRLWRRAPAGARRANGASYLAAVGGGTSTEGDAPGEGVEVGLIGMSRPRPTIEEWRLCGDAASTVAFVTLSQSEADALFRMQKRFRSLAAVDVAPGVNAVHHLDSFDGAEPFIIDVRTNRIRLGKFRYQNRSRRIYILARLCVDGPPHTNPDGVSVGKTHLHRYTEGFEDRFADPIDPLLFSNLSDRVVSFEEFCRVCNVVTLPSVIEAATLSSL